MLSKYFLVETLLATSCRQRQYADGERDVATYEAF